MGGGKTPSQAESAKVRDIINQYEAKYFVSESKTL